MPTIESLIYGLTIAGAMFYAASGVLEAGRKPFDLFGMTAVALAAALGGGSLRDMLLDRNVFWIADQTHLIAALAGGVITFVLARHIRVPPRLFLLLDALGLALFTAVGTQVALNLGAPWLVASLMGVITGAFGGVLRDILLNKTPVIFSSEIYATASWLGALTLIGLPYLGINPSIAALCGGAVVFVLRLIAIHWRWGLPVYSARE